MSSDARVSADSRGTIRSDPEAILAAGAFAHVKRDLVRLLGILADGERAVQDRTRVCGGIPVVMNLCVVDDYNPCESLPPFTRNSSRVCPSASAAASCHVHYARRPRTVWSGRGLELYLGREANEGSMWLFPDMREHAIFALRNLLFGNAENQAVVEEVKPIGRWDEDKVLRDLGRDTA